MSLHDHSSERPSPQGSFLTSPAGLAMIGFLAIAGFLLFTEHRAHVLGAFLWLAVLACPLMHFFMHHGHGGHGGHGSHGDQERDSPRDRRPGNHQH